jgi:hypothetical protein
VGLLCKLELSLHVIKISLILFNTFFLIFVTVFSRFFWRLYFLKKVIMSDKQFLCVNFANFTEWNIWNFVFESSMDENIVARRPARVSESLD